ncbi:MAG: shikimate kinase [Chlamydiales bacterium]
MYNNLNFGLSSLNSEELAQQTSAFSAEGNDQRSFASQKNTTDASKLTEDEVVKQKEQFNIILFGFPNCGKTYFGMRLAQDLGLSFIDTDQLLEKNHSKSVAEIYRDLGEEKFREAELGVLLSIAGTLHTVISLGGGTITHPLALDLLKNMGKLIYLEADKKVLQNRLPPTPFFAPKDFDSFHTERCALYEAVPAFRLSLRGTKEEDILFQLRGLMYG